MVSRGVDSKRDGRRHVRARRKQPPETGAPTVTIDLRSSRHERKKGQLERVERRSTDVTHVQQVAVAARLVGLDPVEPPVLLGHLETRAIGLVALGRRAREANVEPARVEFGPRPFLHRPADQRGSSQGLLEPAIRRTSRETWLVRWTRTAAEPGASAAAKRDRRSRWLARQLISFECQTPVDPPRQNSW